MDMDKYIGRLLDNRYEILEVIGVGGMAVVYKARCHRLNRLVAIKILKDEFSRDEEFRRRFHAESQAVAMLSHSNIVSVYDVSTSDDADYIVMELIDGITLKQYMEKKGVLNWKETLHFAIQISKALEHAHSRGIIHRDIKPHNVMVLKNGSVKVADFGIAQVMSKSNTLTKEALGSVHYISPEQAKGGRVDNRSDIYSLGVVMYEMMTGRPPFDGESPVAVAIQHINGKASMPSTLNPNMPGGLEQIIMKAMEQEPQKRFTTATEMLNDMDEFRKDPTILFDYNNTSTGMDDATLLKRPVEPEPVVPVKIPAEAPARSRNQTPARTAPSRRSAPTGNRRPQRHQKEEIIEEENNRSTVATIAIILCAIVAVAAIGIFIFVLMNADAAPKMVDVPNFVGKSYESIKNNQTVTVVRKDEHSDEHAAGTIIRQEPEAGEQIEQGDTVTVYVSVGEKIEEILMEDLILRKEADALTFLQENLGIRREQIDVKYEPNDIVGKGYVIRTDPGKGENIAGGRMITLYVSTGKTVETGKMPNVVGLDIKTAERLLELNGFDVNKIIREEVDSPLAKGVVVYQSVPASDTTEIPLTTIIIVQVSKGNEATTNPPDAPTEPGADEVFKIVTVELPQDLLQPYVLTIRKQGQIMLQMAVPNDALTIEVELYGKDVETFELWTNSTLYRTFQVDFSETEPEPDPGIEGGE